MIPPYSGKLVNQVLDENEFQSILDEKKIRSVLLSNDDLINVQNIATGVYSPLTGFMTENEYMSIIQHTTLPDGLNWTLPILLHIDKDVSDLSKIGDIVILKNFLNDSIGIIKVRSIFSIDHNEYATNIFETTDKAHPGVNSLMSKSSYCIGGDVYLRKNFLSSLKHQYTPQQIRSNLERNNFKCVTAFSTRNVCHKGHEYLHNLALETSDILSINIITGPNRKGSFLPDVVFDAYSYILNQYYPENRVFLNNLRLPLLHGGPKEAFLQAIMLQNYGCTHFIVGRDHAGVKHYYSKYASQEIFNELQDLDIKILPFHEPRYCKICGKVTTDKICRHAAPNIQEINGTDIRQHLIENTDFDIDNVLRNDLKELLFKMINMNTGTFYSEILPGNPNRLFYH